MFCYGKHFGALLKRKISADFAACFTSIVRYFSFLTVEKNYYFNVRASNFISIDIPMHLDLTVLIIVKFVTFRIFRNIRVE